MQRLFCAELQAHLYIKKGNFAQPGPSNRRNGLSRKMQTHYKIIQARQVEVIQEAQLAPFNALVDPLEEAPSM
ncbi:MAG: hypothetical protein MJH10_04990 [Epibacterium sp.]|nr:hypothetical protein [Epibacterium sp.]NQX72907.1 hypothetical protein [Epibacterium sp.]